MGRVDAQSRRVIGAYRDSRGDQLHVALRVATCPVGDVLAAVPAGGVLLDVGCGHGLFSLLAALDDPSRRVVGADLDADKLVEARRAAERLGVTDRVTFVHGHDGALPLDALPKGGADAVLCVDVLYLLGLERAEALLRAIAGAVRPGGTVVVKEMGFEPTWKRRFTELQEFGATKVLRYTEGEQVELVPPELMLGTLADEGLSVRVERVDRHHLHPHLLLVATAPSS